MPDKDHKKNVTGDYPHDRFVPELTPDLRETIARAIHEAYRQLWRGKVHNPDLSRAKWDKLPDYLKESNRQQADHIFTKLQRIGCTVHKVTDRNITPMIFTEDEIEIMAEMEHARWNEERLLGGWKLGEERDTANKISPYLVGWPELSEDAKELDRQIVRKIPEFLAKVGLEIQR